MAQKDKVKELVGGGLNAYHTKSLQQIDRIEKKNKEQNHKISMLTNELDNDYLTKIEEGSVISLEHSKEGMVYIDSLEGNTLVNYCTDGAKELTLNGDIDLEGTFVTTSEGVDNGKVDVYCEGNTLVNIFPTNIDLTNPNSNVAESLNYFSRIFPLLQNGKTYTAMFINSPTTIYQVYISACGIPWTNITNNKAVFTVNYESFDSSAPRNLQFMSTGITPIDELTNFKIIILEGDWTDREIPPYFEGMKSVGQDDENGHKIEILSTNSDGSESNKKEILLNEPLRGLSNGIKDRFVKIGNKWFIERNRGIRKYQEGDLDLTDVITDMTNTEYSLETPTYEPLEINPELTCYNDTTHISNNSIVPCNMKIKNSGYNAIIKPSTLYTVVLYTNKSGTIGMNLGGVKGTTTNNVLTLTTPATLSDDSLRIYGKGIKGSKVRLLEGDKTNWIPSFFEGMKSSFEDKVQEDGSYKMEILSNNKNLFDGNWTRIGNSKQHETSYIKVSPNSNYIFSVSDNYNTNSAERRFNVQFYDKHKNYLGFIVTGYLPNNVKINTPYNCKYIKIITRANTDFTGEYTNIEYCDVQLEKGMEVTSYVSPKSNKIQFSSIEPLRKINNDIKDRFVLKEDNKIYIERNCGEVVFNGNTNWSIWNDFDDFNNRKTILFYTTINGKHTHNCKCDKFYENGSHNTDYEGIKSGGNTNTVWFAIDKIKLNTLDKEGFNTWLRENNVKYCYKLAEPTYEEIPFELQKIILEGYENGTLFFDTNIPPTSTVTYAGETPIVKSIKLNKTEVLNNTNDINDNIIPYLMDMDYRVVCLELATETQGISMARLFGGTYEMLQRDILSKRYSVEEYKYRLDAYLSVNKITEKEYEELGEMLNE